VINLDGTNPITIPVHFKDGAVAWSNDGEWLAFGGGESQPGMPRPFLWSRRSDDIWQVGSETTQSDYIFSDPVWSPDNQWLAFNSSNESLCVVEVENGDIKCFKGYLSAIGTAPEWSPDSRAIIVASNRIGKLVMGDADLIWDLFIISVPDGAVTRITDDSSESKGELWPIWVP
jgi:Tol biopolymer transport system component